MVTQVSHVFDMLSGVSLSFAKKQVDKSTICYSYSLSLTIFFCVFASEIQNNSVTLSSVVIRL